MVKAALISPPYGNLYGSYRSLFRKGFLNQPLGLLYLSASLKDKGHEVIVIDAEAREMGFDSILAVLLDAQPDLIGISATSPEFQTAVELATGIKKYMTTPIVLGGVHLTISKEEILKQYRCFDFGVIGEGEFTLVELVECLGYTAKYPTIRGIVYRDGEEVVLTDPRPPIENLDDLPFPDMASLDNNLYIRSVPRLGYRPTASFMSSRGCPCSCIYCAIEQIPGWRHVRFRSAKNVVDEIEYIINKLGIRHISFNDDVLTLRKQRMLEICDEIMRRGLKFTWEGISRADCVDKEMLTMMKAAGLVRIAYGIESGDPEILKLIGKNETHEQIREAFRITREIGIVARGSVIIGLPYENKQTVKKTFQFINSLYGLDQVSINILQPYPGTKVREMVLNGEGGSRVLTEDLSELRRFGNASVEVNDLTQKDLVGLQKKGWLSFYLHPARFFRNISIYHPKVLLIDGLAFLRAIF